MRTGFVIASAAWQSRWCSGGLGRDEIATAQAPRNGNLLNSEQLPWHARLDTGHKRAYNFRAGLAYGQSRIGV